MNIGKVYLIGAGPGDADLISVRGSAILGQADVVIHDYLVDTGMLKYVRDSAEIISVKEYDKSNRVGHLEKQRRIDKMMVRRAKEGKLVVRLKSGDPFMFGRAVEEMRVLLDNTIEYAVVPGISAANAASCFTGIPLTSRGIASSLAIVTGHKMSKQNKLEIDWKSIAGLDTIVLYMAVETLPCIQKELLNNGKMPDTPVAVISKASKVDQRLVKGKLSDIVELVRREKIQAPAIFIIGRVVNLESTFNWYRKSEKILFTGLSEPRFAYKGNIFHCPLIKIKPLRDYSKMHSLFKRLDEFNWIFFSSRYGVQYFFRELLSSGLDCRALNSLKIAAIGTSTAKKLKEYGMLPDLIPKVESAKGLLNAFRKYAKGVRLRVLLPRSDIGEKGLTSGLKKLGVNVTVCPVYHNVMQEDYPGLAPVLFDKIIFTSPSTVRSYFKKYKLVPKGTKIETIGTVTKKELTKFI